ETGMPGERKAAAYIENEFRRIGLQPANKGNFHMFYNIYQDSLINAGFEVNGEAFQLDKDFNVNIGNNIDGILRFNELIYAGNQSLDSLRKMNLAGKLVMVHRSAGNAFSSVLTNKGVAGIIYIAPDFPKAKPAIRKGNHVNNIYKRVVAPQQYIVSESVARKILKDQFTSLTENTSTVATISTKVAVETRKIQRAIPTSNVLGMIEGTDLKDQYLFITAHHDHIGMRDTIINYGADDDGSGTVSVIELAEAFARAKAEGKGPRRTVVFMTVSGEEKGLWGSEYYGNNPVFPLAQTTANLNIDMIGRIDPKRALSDSLNYVYVVGDDKLSSELRPISESVNKKYTKLGLDYKFNDPNDPMRIYFRSDHYNFAKHGVPIIFYFNGTHADYHRPTDTPDKINYTLMAKRAQFVFYTAWEMANRNNMISRDIPMDASLVR
ncbi:MAG: M28 family peptidase, partial [Flavisolibacter sp.]|nr:M28 family peptidase [Flavisolibacter sp.]